MMKSQRLPISSTGASSGRKMLVVAGLRLLVSARVVVVDVGRLRVACKGRWALVGRVICV